VVDDSDPEAESDLRRRAAWLLVMLAIVAVLLVVVISALAGGDNSDDNAGGPGPLDSAATTAGSSSSDHHSGHPRRHHPGDGTSSSNSSSTSSVPAGELTCPTADPCILEGDVDNSIQAINDFRAEQGLPAVPGSVSPQAQTCALNQGNGCSGGWAMTLLSHPNSAEAVQKIEEFAHFEDPNMTSVEVGWAYDPGAHLYYFAIVRND
jgi:hypothetical protein